MAASPQVYQNKRGRDEYWNGGFILPDAKRKNSRALAHDTALMSLLEKIDNMDSCNDNNPGDLSDVGINGVVNSLEDEIQLKAQTYHNVDSTDESSSAHMASIKQDQITADHGSTEATLTLQMTPDIWDFTYFDDVGAELGFLIDLIASRELGIMIDGIHGDSMPHIMYSDTLYGYAETTEVFYGSLWEDDSWHLNEDPVIQNDFSSPQQEEGFGITGRVEFHDVGNDSKPIQRVSNDEE